MDAGALQRAAAAAAAAAIEAEALAVKERRQRQRQQQRQGQRQRQRQQQQQGVEEPNSTVSSVQTEAINATVAQPDADEPMQKKKQTRMRERPRQHGAAPALYLEDR